MKGVVFDLQDVGLVPGESVEGLYSGFSSVAHLILLKSLNEEKR